MISRRADLTAVFAMIFRRLRSARADWQYRGRAWFVVSHTPRGALRNQSLGALVSARLRERRRDIDDETLSARLDGMIARARERILKRPTPPTVLGYHRAYGRDPSGWPLVQG